MTNEQINTAIAEACGRKRNPKGGWYPDNGWEFGTQGILNYCNDLNAMHEAEKVLTDTGWLKYRNELRAIFLGPTILVSEWCKCDLHATARQRAEAFLRTLGKWLATDKESLTVGATTEESSEVQSTSSGGSGGASTYGGKGLGIAGATWPPETRITVNGKTFCLADIDKEMTE